jgi:potassium-dependent mechanosensitive channel
MTGRARMRRLAAVLAAAMLLSAPSVCAQIAPQPAPSLPIAPPPPALGAPAASPAPAEHNVAEPIAVWDAELNRLEADVGKTAGKSERLDGIRQQLDDLRQRIRAYVAEQSPRLPELDARLKKLGEAPKDGAPPEPKPVAEQRGELRKAIGDITGALKAAQEAQVRIDALDARIRDTRRALFGARILERGPSPLTPSLWRAIAEDAPIGITRMGFMLSNWWATLADPALFIGFFFAAIAIWALLSVFSYRRIQQLRAWTAPEPPSDWRRATSAGRVILLRAMPTAIASGFLYFGLTEAGLVSANAQRIVIAAVASLITVVATQSITKTALAVLRPRWRLLKLSDTASRALYDRLMLLAAVYGIDFFISEASQTAFMPFSVTVGQSFISSMLFAGLIISILRIRETPATAEGKPRFIGPGSIRAPLWIVALTILGAALIGYVALARFIAGQLIVTSTILIIAYLLIIWASAFGQSMGDDKAVPGAWLRDNLGLEERRREQLALPVMLVLKAAIVIAAVPLILLLWGFDWYDITAWWRDAMLGFEIGGARISITTILIALLIFVAFYAAAKVFQVWLDSAVLVQAGVEPGVRASIRTVVGYLGVVLAAILAISYIGLDFSSLAIVAGALSVGVGFGLQSIVNNFVSGLILLVERPIKVGDWIIVGGHEGIVAKISVRSTEIETFDRANLIVPNSMLISDMVKNWTLHNATGRMPIPIGVHYDSDPEAVRDILLEVAEKHPQVLTTPPPFVFFEDFGASSLNFILFVYLTNVNRSFAVRTDLRIAILKAFRARGIEIPYQQTDVHLRDLDWIRKALADRKPPPADPGPMTVRDYTSESHAPGDSDGNGQ